MHSSRWLSRLLVLAAVMPLAEPLPAFSESHAVTLPATPPSSPFILADQRGTWDPVPLAESRLIRFANGIAIDTRAGEPAVPWSLRQDSGVVTGRAACLVQLDGPIRTGWRQALLDAGAEIFFYLPNYAYLVRADAAGLERIRALPFVVWTGAYQPAYKLSSELDLSPGAARQKVSILLFPGESLAEVSAFIVAGGGRILQTSTPSSPNLVIEAEVGGEQVVTLASLPGVILTEPLCFIDTDNDQAQWVLQTDVPDDREIWDHGITGEGQVLAISDTPINPEHYAFLDPAVPITGFGDYPAHRKIIAYRRALDNSDILFQSFLTAHGTWVASTACGNDTLLGSSPRDGMAKDAKIYFQDMEAATGQLWVPADLNDLFIQPYIGNAGGSARVGSNSWGCGYGSGVYNLRSMQVDQFTWQHPDFLTLYSAGNLGCEAEWWIGGPAVAKNCITVGGTMNGAIADSIFRCTSRGPASDGRLKPTLCAPARVVTASRTPNFYDPRTGTSAACAAAGGMMLLARQYLAEGRYPTGIADPARAFSPSAALLKAMAVIGGQDDMRSHVVPDTVIGWGRLKLGDVLHFPGDTSQTVLLEAVPGLSTGEYTEYQFRVSSSAVPLRIALVWSDYPGSPGAGRALVNDLDLTAGDGATLYRGNVFSGGQSVAGGNTDTLNVEECVWRDAPATGLWTVRVAASNTPMGPQSYALAVSGALALESGAVALDRPEYGGSDTLSVRVQDGNAGDSATVAVCSSTEGIPETMSLGSGTGGAGGFYQGRLPLTLAGPVHGDGRLSVSHGDSIAAVYVDADPSSVSRSSARVHLDPPSVSGVGLTGRGPNSATIGWTTSDLATSTVYYGTTPSLGSVKAMMAPLVTQHSVTLEDLACNSSYLYDVESRDAIGNTVRDDNGGNHYRFDTSEKGDVLLVLEHPGFGADRYHAAFARTGWTFDRWGREEALDPHVGDLTSGLRSYRAVWWGKSFEYTGVTLLSAFVHAEVRDSISRYHEGGGRLSVAGWSIARELGQPDSTEASEWLADVFHVRFIASVGAWTGIRGHAGDAISGGHAGGVPFTPPYAQQGYAGDRITIQAEGGDGQHIWTSQGPATNGEVAVRWTAGSPGGSPDSAVWGGTPTKVVTHCFEWAYVNGETVPDDPVRADILDKTLIWLIGRDHPDVTVTAPDGGEILAGATVTVSWNESCHDAGAGARRIEYSDDGGDSWNLVTANAGASPYSWDVSGIPNGITYRVRVTVVDNGTPTLRGSDTSGANFTLNRAGGDTRGPRGVPGTAGTTPHPVVAPGTFVLAATIDDARTGNTNIAAAEWSVGARPCDAGAGTAMSGVFTSPAVAVRDTIDASTLSAGWVPVWIRGRDAAGQWGPADSLAIFVNGGATSVAGSMPGPAVFALDQNVPNPFHPGTVIRFGLATPGRAFLVVYDVSGRVVRRLVDGTLAAGRHEVRWDSRDTHGHRVAPGIYFYRLEAGDRQAIRKMALMR